MDLLERHRAALRSVVQAGMGFYLDRFRQRTGSRAAGDQDGHHDRQPDGDHARHGDAHQFSGPSLFDRLHVRRNLLWALFRLPRDLHLLDAGHRTFRQPVCHLYLLGTRRPVFLSPDRFLFRKRQRGRCAEESLSRQPRRRYRHVARYPYSLFPVPYLRIPGDLRSHQERRVPHVAGLADGRGSAALHGLRGKVSPVPAACMAS